MDKNECIGICQRMIYTTENYWNKLGIDDFSQVVQVPKGLYEKHSDIFDKYYVAPKYRIHLMDNADDRA